ncbi:glycosyltransferase [Aquabacterium soli]|uniref:Glycosyltransferase n=1 Tax=Aquabacterium soli TaxID=2493092 RepID=A0A3R8T1I1_9BURK|nr:glycosyltransferase family 4 protein [Aquabacterium soli]RRR99937.1 glycosyltransferase [Aquabacterium soli]
MKNIVLMQYRLFHYRMGLFNMLRDRAREAGLNIILVVGNPYSRELAKNDEGHLDWAHKVKNLYFPIGEKKDLCWQPVPKEHQAADLIVFMQENRLLSNYYWILKRYFFNGPKVAYWGHGRDFQTRAPGGLREKWKNTTLRWVDWWFAYTDISKNEVISANFPEARITVLNNAIDVKSLRRDWTNALPSDVERVKAECNLRENSFVGLFCGSLYSDKKLELLLESIKLVHARNPNFRMIIVGDGPDRPWLEEAINPYDWIKWVGAKRGAEKALYFGVADIVLNPGLVGLHVLDALSMGLPMITTLTAQHSPEISYLEAGKNGQLTAENARSYSDAIIELMENPHLLKVMSDYAYISANKYTLENMVENFVSGMCKAVGLAPPLSKEQQ